MNHVLHLATTRLSNSCEPGARNAAAQLGRNGFKGAEAQLQERSEFKDNAVKVVSDGTLKFLCNLAGMDIKPEGLEPVSGEDLDSFRSVLSEAWTCEGGRGLSQSSWRWHRRNKTCFFVRSRSQEGSACGQDSKGRGKTSCEARVGRT
eukprot:3814350-Amphidinium_carterae.1